MYLPTLPNKHNWCRITFILQHWGKASHHFQMGLFLKGTKGKKKTINIYTSIQIYIYIYIFKTSDDYFHPSFFVHIFYHVNLNVNWVWMIFLDHITTKKNPWSIFCTQWFFMFCFSQLYNLWFYWDFFLSFFRWLNDANTISGAINSWRWWINDD